MGHVVCGSAGSLEDQAMRAPVSAALILLGTICLPLLAKGQTEGAPAIARDTFRRQVESNERVVVPPRVVREVRVPDPVIVERAAVVERPAVVERQVVRQAVVPERTVTWWTAFARNRYGYHDDAYVDDDWYYDFYELPRAAPAVVDRAVGTLPPYRTTWIFEPVAERGLFSW
jgi:hypothetical protein